jgi:hypothetical protein
VQFSRSCDCRSDAARTHDVIFFYQDGVEQANAVVPAATAFNGIFLGQSQSRDRLARIENTAPGSSYGVHIRRSYRCRRCKSLQEIQSHTFAAENRASGAPQDTDGGVGLKRFSVVGSPLAAYAGIQLAKYFVDPGTSRQRHVVTCDNRRRNDFGFRNQFGGQVSAAYVFS